VTGSTRVFNLQILSSLAEGGLNFMFLQILGVAPRIKIHYLDPTVDRSIKIVQQLEQVFEPYRVFFKELQEEKQLPIQRFLTHKQSAKILTYMHFLEGGDEQLFADFYLSRRFLEPNDCENEG
jgi:hypothetical protein